MLIKTLVCLGYQLFVKTLLINASPVACCQKNNLPLQIESKGDAPNPFIRIAS